MKSSPTGDPAPPVAAPGRPKEIEEATNLWLVHPLSRVLVDRLIGTPATPDQVSLASVLAAAAGAFCYARAPWPWDALAGLGFFFLWHVLDGADGDLARRTGRASTAGELIDGICDHVSQALLYLALAVILQRGLGAWAWAIAAAAAYCHFIQANAYETGRKTYRRWVHGAAWMRQNPQSLSRMDPVRGTLAGLYLRVSGLSNPGERRIEAAMDARLSRNGESAERARALYGELYAPLVKASAVLGGNVRTLAAFLSVLAGAPLWFFLFEIVALNLALIGLTLWRRRIDGELAARLAGAAQAAAAPN
ncbi:MAG: CDP-alcohol phosphatidyltransferase family protein [Caulobacteraceae bacterium]